MRAYVDGAGWLGAALVLGAYALHTSGRIHRFDVYQLVNALGSVGLGAAAAQHHNWPSTVLNLLWLAVAATGLRRTPAAPGGEAGGVPTRALEPAETSLRGRA